MNNIPPKLRVQLATDPFYKVCARKGIFGHECAGRITWEHSMYFAGKQIQARWAIVPLCAKGHSVNEYQDSGDMDKHINEWIALNRANEDDLLPICKTIDYFHYRNFLNKKYGYVFVEPLFEKTIEY